MKKSTKRRILYGLVAVWPALWLNLFDSLVGIFTLGYYVPSTNFRWFFFVMEKKWFLKGGLLDL